MKRIISTLIYVFRNEKKKLFFFLGMVLFFMLVLFPFGDVSDLVTAQIARATNNQVFVQFNNPGFSIFPDVGFELKDVHVETNFLPPLQAKSLTISPSIKGLLTFKPGVKLSASDMLGGDVGVSLQQTSVEGKSGQIVNVDGDDVELSQVLALANYKLPVKGTVDLNSTAEFEPTFSQQPTAEVQMQINKFDLSSVTVATPIGPLNLPNLAISKVNFQGDLKEGRLSIEQFVAGGSNDELTANIKGRVDLRVLAVGGSAEVQPGPYDLEVRLTTKESFQKKAGTYLSLMGLEPFKKPGPNGSILYAFSLKGQNFNLPPVMAALQ